MPSKDSMSKVVSASDKKEGATDVHDVGQSSR